MKKVQVLLFVFFSLLMIIGCNQNPNTETSKPGYLKIVINHESISEIADNEPITVYVRMLSPTGPIAKSVVLSKDKTEETIELKADTYYLTFSNNITASESVIIVNPDRTSVVSLNYPNTGFIKFVLSDDAKNALSKISGSVDIQIRKTMESVPLAKVMFGYGIFSNKEVKIEKGKYYISYASNVTDKIEFKIPDSVEVKVGGISEVLVDIHPKGTVKININKDEGTVYPFSFRINFYRDEEKTDLVSFFDYSDHSGNHEASLDPGDYYVSYECNSGEAFIIDDYVSVVAGGESILNVSVKPDIGTIWVQNRYYSANIQSEYETAWTKIDSEDSSTFTFKGEGILYLEKGEYIVELNNDPDKTGIIASIDPENNNITINSTFQDTLYINNLVVGFVDLSTIGFKDVTITLEFDKIVGSNEPENKVVQEVNSIDKRIYLPIGEYRVNGKLNTSDDNLDFSLPSDFIQLYHKKKIEYNPEVFKTGVLELSVSNDFYEKLDKLSVVVHLYRNGEYFRDLVISETTRENNRWYLPEGVYTYELEYDKDLMNLAFDADSFTVSYAKTTPIVCNKYGFARCIAVDIQNKIPGASKIEYYSYQDYPVLKIRLRNYPDGSVIKLYDMSNGTRCLGEGDYFEISLDQQGINKDNLQIRITKNNMLLDVQQIGNLWK